VDLLLIGAVLALLYFLARLSAGVVAPFSDQNPPQVDLNPANLPYYAGRSLLRMFVALGISFLFTLGYGYAAAKSRRLERVLVPLLDILQSVPVLGFLSVTITTFIALFPGSTLGLESAAIFAIFTGQAWNMTFAFYSSLKTLPPELTEVATGYRLSRWQRFVKLELPAAVIPLSWNSMMSFGGGWFFLSVSETITVLNHSYTLPGVGSYLALAILRHDFGALAWALLTMIIMIVAVDQIFWRPIVAWSDKFKLETTRSADGGTSWVLALLRRSGLAAWARLGFARLNDGLTATFRILRPRTSVNRAGLEAPSVNPRKEFLFDLAFYGLLSLVLLIAFFNAYDFIAPAVGWDGFLEVLGLGLLTFLRVLAMLVISTVVWVPVGVWIGFNPKIAGVLQPVIQVFASFPANFLFPFATIFFLRTAFPIDLGAMVLMSLGAQWYILFNVISGALAVPNDLREASRNLGLRGWQRWRRLILPGIFGAWVTGAITASGGAWNASIVAEVVTWGNATLQAQGLGAYITQATTSGDWPRIILGVGVMSLFVVALNRLFWHRLYRLAETRYKLG
jgi:NitT/TauT family transport system permease protein